MMEGNRLGFSFQISDIPALISVALMILGFRLLRISRQNSSAPEFLIGLYMIISPPATSIMMRLHRFDPQIQPMLQSLVEFGIGFSAICLAAFAWRVFRPNATWARVLTGLVACYFAVGFALGFLDSSARSYDVRTNVTRFVLVGLYFWLWIECRQHRKVLLKRLRIGLADPVVVNRFLLFEIWFGVMALLPGLVLLGAVYLTSTGIGTEGPIFATIMRITGLFIYGAMWLAFMPPAGYRRWLKRRYQQHYPDATLAGTEA
jgi:hypothetical protein